MWNVVIFKISSIKFMGFHQEDRQSSHRFFDGGRPAFDFSGATNIYTMR